MRSAEKARSICCKVGQHPLLLGSSKRVLRLTRENHIKIATAVSHPPTEISPVSMITKKCFLMNVGHKGVVVSNKDKSIVTLGCSEAVVCVQQFLSVRSEGGNCLLLSEGNVKPFQHDGNGQIEVNFFIGFPKIEMQHACQMVFFSCKNIARRVVLYDCGNNIGIAVDYMRNLRSLAYERVVPAYPEKHVSQGKLVSLSTQQRCFTQHTGKPFDLKEQSFRICCKGALGF